MNLELKHLAPYLENGITVKVKDNIFKIIGLTSTSVIRIGINGHGLVQEKIEDVKPILRPMSVLKIYLDPLYGTLENQDVTDFLDQDFLDEHKIFSLDDLAITDPRYIPFGTLQLLLKHHFDVFDLITQKLAISIYNVGETVC